MYFNRFILLLKVEIYIERLTDYTSESVIFAME